MNILLLTYQGQTAGSTLSISYLAQGLQNRGHSVYIGCRSNSYFPRLLKNSSITILPMKLKKRFDLSSIKEIAVVVTTYEIHIVNAQSSIDRYNSILARWIYSLSTSIIHTRRQMPASLGFFLQNWFYTKGTDRIVAVSKGVQKGLTALGIPESKISVIYNGTPPEKYDNIKKKVIETIKNRFNLKDSDTIIGCVSRRKKQKQLFQALQYIKKPVKCLCVGIDKIDEDDALLQSIAHTHTVHFVGNINEHEVLHYYTVFTVKVLASTSEGFSQALLEAMALGTPVIATDASGNNELILSGENGFLFKDNDIQGLAKAINTLIHSKQLRQSFSKKGRERALHHFSMERTIQGYEQLFNSCIEGIPFQPTYP